MPMKTIAATVKISLYERTFGGAPPPNSAHATISGVENTAIIANRAVHMLWWVRDSCSVGWPAEDSRAMKPTNANHAMAAISGIS